MPLEVDIASKTFRNAAGEQHDVIAGVAFTLDAGTFYRAIPGG